MIIYHSVFIIIKSTTLPHMFHFGQEKDHKYVMQHRTSHNRLLILKRERNEHPFTAKKKKLRFETGRWNSGSAQAEPCVYNTHTHKDYL